MGRETCLDGVDMAVNWFAGERSYEDRNLRMEG